MESIDHRRIRKLLIRLLPEETQEGGRGGVTTWIYVLLMLVPLCGSAFFSASEMALSSANRMRLASAAEEGNRAAEIACKVIDKYENALSAILIGNNLCNIGSDSIVTVLGIAPLGEKI